MVVSFVGRVVLPRDLAPPALLPSGEEGVTFGLCTNSRQEDPIRYRECLGVDLGSAGDEGLVVAVGASHLDGLVDLLTRLREAPVRVRVPRRGAGLDLVQMAARNAALALEEHSARARAAHGALTRLGTLLDLTEQ